MASQYEVYNVSSDGAVQGDKFDSDSDAQNEADRLNAYHNNNNFKTRPVSDDNDNPNLAPKNSVPQTPKSTAGTKATFSGDAPKVDPAAKPSQPVTPTPPVA